MKKFDVICLPEKTKKLFFQYRYVNVSKSITKEIDLKKIDIYLKDYRIKVSEAVLEQYSNSIYEDILNELNSGIHFITMKHPKHRYEKWLRGLFFLDTMSLMKKLFISTIVYLSEEAKCPETESITFTFDLDAEEVVISSLTLYMPENNPYYKYAQKAAVNLSVESIGLLNYAGNKKIKNFYNESVVGKWKKASELEKEKDVKDVPGIYMLYNADTNELYVGKAVRIKGRIEQHQKDVNDYMKDFTHYRYSAICEEYFEFLYLIENAAIHDIAQILEMPNAKIYKSPLIKIAPDISRCKITNRVEYQTKKQS